MSKLVIVETISVFRHVYAVELADDEPIEHALDDVVMHEKGMDEFAQVHINEDIFSHREITEEEYVRIFDEMNGYLKDWSLEEKKKFIYKRD